MTQKELLHALGLSREEFRDLLEKFGEFRKSLNPAQLDTVDRSLPTISQAVRSLGSDLTPEQLTKIVKKLYPNPQEEPGDGGSIFSKFTVKRANKKLAE